MRIFSASQDIAEALRGVHDIFVDALQRITTKWLAFLCEWGQKLINHHWKQKPVQSKKFEESPI